MKTIVITGGTKGIGLAIAKKFLNNEYQVFICGSSAESVSSIREMNLKNLIVNQVDMANKSEIRNWALDILSKIGTIDVLVNNAGRFIPGEIGEEEEGAFETMISTNLASAYHCTRAFLPSFKAAKAGHIFNICSTASITAYTNGGSYCISKFGLLGMSKVLREELKPHGIKVTSLLPGATFTDSWASSGLPESRFISPDDIAELIFTSCHLNASTVVEELLIRPLQGDIG